MRRSSLLFCIVFILRMSVSNVLGASNDLPKVSISVLKMNVMYVGINNPIEITVEGLEVNGFQVSVSQGTVHLDENRYIVVPESLGTLQVMVTKKDGTKISSHNFRVKDIPLPIAKVGFKRGGSSVSVSQMKAQLGVTCVLENFDFDVRYSVTSFQCVLYKKDGVSKQISNEGPMFSQQLKNDILSNLEAGDLIMFKDILSKCSNGKEVVVAPIFYFIE